MIKEIFIDLDAKHKELKELTKKEKKKLNFITCDFALIKKNTKEKILISDVMIPDLAKDKEIYFNFNSIEKELIEVAFLEQKREKASKDILTEIRHFFIGKISTFKWEVN